VRRCINIGLICNFGLPHISSHFSATV